VCVVSLRRARLGVALTSPRGGVGREIRITARRGVSPRRVRLECTDLSLEEKEGEECGRESSPRRVQPGCTDLSSEKGDRWRGISHRRGCDFRVHRPLSGGIGKETVEKENKILRRSHKNLQP